MSVMNKQIILRNKRLILAVILVILGFTLAFIEPYVFSVATGVPCWFLSPKISFFTSEKQLLVKLNTTDFTLGSAINVTVCDASKSGLLIAGADIKLSSDGVTFFENITTDSRGNATFIYSREPTILFVSKANYSDVDPIFIPKPPDWWVTVRNCQYITFIVTLLASWVSAFHVYMQWTVEHLRMLLLDKAKLEKRIKIYSEKYKNKTELELIGELSKIHSDKYKMSRFHWRMREKLGISPDAILNIKKEAKRQAIMKILREVYGWK